MSMSDCPECWDTPCECGYEYRHWSPERLAKQIQLFQWIAACQLSERNGTPVKDDKHGTWARWKAKDAKEQAERAARIASYNQQ